MNYNESASLEVVLWISLIFYQIVIYMMPSSFVQVTLDPYSIVYNYVLAISWILSVPTSIALFHYCRYGRLNELDNRKRQGIVIIAVIGSIIAFGILFIAWVMFYLIILTLFFIFIVQIWSGYKLFITKNQ